MPKTQIHLSIPVGAEARIRAMARHHDRSFSEEAAAAIVEHTRDDGERLLVNPKELHDELVKRGAPIEAIALMLEALEAVTMRQLARVFGPVVAEAIDTVATKRARAAVARAEADAITHEPES